MKVLWLAPHPVPGAYVMHPAPWITSLAEQLFSNGIRVTVVTVDNTVQEPVSKFNLGAYDLVVLKSTSGYVDVFTFFKKRIGIIRKFLADNIYEYDLVHVHGTEKQYASAITKEMQERVPVVISIQGLISKYIKYINDFITIRRVMWQIGSVYEKAEIKTGLNFFCRTHWDTGSVLDLNPKAKIFEVWEIMRQEFYDNTIKKRGGNIILSGGSNSLKGLKHALQVLNKLLAEEKIILHVIGNCSWDYVEGIVKQFSLNNVSKDNVKLHGMVGSEKILDLYEDCFCLYHPSLIDNSPNTVCEAQLSGLPVVASNVGGVGSLIIDNVTGILLNQDIDKDYQVLKSFRLNISLQETIATEARKVALERHDYKLITNKVIGIYKELSKK